MYVFARRGVKAREMKLPITQELMRFIKTMAMRYLWVKPPVVFLETDSPQVGSLTEILGLS